MYNKLSNFYKEKFKERTLKICVNAGFTCPNRDGKKGFGGCIFCSEKGSGENIINIGDVESQINSYLNSYKAKRANKFIVYFQNFTNTYANINKLKTIYDKAFVDNRIVGIDIDTRPDEINEEVVKLLSKYKEKYYVVVELGLQTVNEHTHKLINQNITNDEFLNAVFLLNKYGIDVVVHIMIGLPNETHDDIVNVVDFLNNIKYQGIKIHSTYVIKNTILEQLYLSNKYLPIDFDTYFNEVIYVLTHINKNIIVHRITGDPPKDIFVAPSWALHKKYVLNNVEKYFKKNNLEQGCFYKQ